VSSVGCLVIRQHNVMSAACTAVKTEQANVRYERTANVCNDKT